MLNKFEGFIEFYLSAKNSFRDNTNNLVIEKSSLYIDYSLLQQLNFGISIWKKILINESIRLLVVERSVDSFTGGIRLWYDMVTKACQIYGEECFIRKFSSTRIEW